MPVSFCRLLLPLVLCGLTACAGLREKKPVATYDSRAQTSRPREGVRVTYLGTNGYLLEARDCTLLVDPYFSRAPMLRVGLGLPVASNPSLVKWGLERGRVPKKVDAILVTHGHIDHLLDSPEILRRTDARLIASPTSVQLVRSTGIPAQQCRSVTAGDFVQLRGARIHVLAATHDRIFGAVPFHGDPPRGRAPRKASEWVCGEPLSFLVEMGSQKIFIDSGGTSGGAAPNVGRVDLAILGVALPDARRRIPRYLVALRPRYFLPSHQDNFFRPLDRGFQFGPLTDFSAVRSAAQQSHARMIFLDYFQPWTLR